MQPLELATELRRIAAAIDSSKHPKRELVMRDLSRLYRVALSGSSDSAGLDVVKIVPKPGFDLRSLCDAISTYVNEKCRVVGNSVVIECGGRQCEDVFDDVSAVFNGLDGEDESEEQQLLLDLVDHGYEVV